MSSNGTRSVRDAPVLVAGAGIGGLATALALAQHNIASHIFERKTSPSEEGAGIQIGPNGVRILRRLGVADALAAHTSSPDALRVMDGLSGRELTALPLGRAIEQRHGAPYWTAHRADLHAALMQAATTNPLITLSLGSDVQSAASDATRASATLSDGTQQYGSVLIVAGGQWSHLRQTVFKCAPLQHSAKNAYRAVIPAQSLPGGLSKTSTHIWFSPSAHVVHYPVRGGQDIAIVAVLDGIKLSPSWGIEIAAPALQSHFLHATDALQKLIRQPASWRGWPLMVSPDQSSWVEGRIALLGDAAHPILPFLAQGAVMALEDAVTLAAKLAHAPGAPEQALAAYALARKPRRTRVAAASERNGKTYHLQGVMALARNTVLRSVAPLRLLARYDWLYGWRIDENDAI